MKPIEVIYEEIASYIVQNIFEDWSTAWIMIEVEDGDVYTMQGEYQINDVIQQQKSFRVDHNIALLFSDLRKRVKRDDTDVWYQAKFTLGRDGEFKIEFTY